MSRRSHRTWGHVVHASDALCDTKPGSERGAPLSPGAQRLVCAPVLPCYSAAVLQCYSGAVHHWSPHRTHKLRARAVDNHDQASLSEALPPAHIQRWRFGVLHRPWRHARESPQQIKQRRIAGHTKWVPGDAFAPTRPPSSPPVRSEWAGAHLKFCERGVPSRCQDCGFSGGRYNWVTEFYLLRDTRVVQVSHAQRKAAPCVA